MIRETLRVYKEVCGKPAKGWLSSSLRCTLNTVDILAEEGLIFTTDLLNDDQPYMVETRSGKPMVSIPYTSEVNDFTVFMRQGQDVDGAFKVFKEQFDWLYRESAKSGRFMNIGLHPHVIGQPFRIRALHDFVAYVKSVRRCLVRHPRGDRRVVSEEPQQPHRLNLASHSRHVGAAVHPQHLAGHIRAVGPEQKHHRSHDISRNRDPFHRVHRVECIDVD